ncbi:hypothetical protein C8F01DRAFT_1375062 [Mycena amicta]|nr:hypothetical protein C8F01DRAFT_1375062 [Mycena amicta]
MDVDVPVERAAQPPVDDPPSQHPRMEEVEDDTTNDPISTYDPRALHRQRYPVERKAGKGQWMAETPFQTEQKKRDADGQTPQAPFPSLDDWDLGRWLVQSGLSQGKIDEFLHLKTVQEKMDPPYATSRAFFKHIDSLPSGPPWMCTPMTITGDEMDKAGKAKTEVVELWHRNPLECIAELLGNPAFEGDQTFKPMRLFRTRDMATGVLSNREYDEMWTGTWWWDTQDKLEDGATIVPIILSSDKTQLSSFAGDKQAWPVYISIGNISKSIRRQPSSRATVLLGYIPVPKLDCYSKPARKIAAYQIFHDCMRKMLEVLVDAGRDGVDMACADGWVRWVFPLLAAYIADYPEQCLVVCCQENSCPRCSCPPKERGLPTEHPKRTQEETLRVLQEESDGLKPKEFRELNLRPVNPFWADLPHCDIHGCITPDLLHQLHKGVFADHISKWAAHSMDGKEEERNAELDARFKTMPRHPTLRHFANGTSVIKQWTGSEYRGLAKTFLGAVHDAVDDRVTSVTRHLLDFMGYAHFQVHTDDSLAAMQASWEQFHDDLPVFENVGPERTDFNIPKLHNIRHYIDSIRLLGSADGYNTENTERLHIDLAKNGYRASNRRDFVQQMTRWLTRQEAVHRFSLYLQWACPGYTPGQGYKPLPNVDWDDWDQADEMEDDPDDEEPARVTYDIAARPAYANLSVADVEKHFQVRDFLFYVQKFLAETKLPGADLLQSTTRINAYKKAALHLPLVRAAETEAETADVIQAILATDSSISNTGIKRGSPAKFSTVLVRVKEADWKEGPLSGVEAAHVKLIFRLPSNISAYKHPLVYVHWFTPFRNSLTDFQSASGFSRIAHSTTVGQRRSGVVSLANILQTCHLIPKFPSTADADWNCNSILNQASVFYFNPYLRHRDFYIFRYQMYLVADYHKRKAAELAARMKEAVDGIPKTIQRCPAEEFAGARHRQCIERGLSPDVTSPRPAIAKLSEHELDGVGDGPEATRVCKPTGISPRSARAAPSVNTDKCQYRELAWARCPELYLLLYWPYTLTRIKAISVASTLQRRFRPPEGHVSESQRTPSSAYQPTAHSRGDRTRAWRPVAKFITVARFITVSVFFDFQLDKLVAIFCCLFFGVSRHNTSAIVALHA